MSSTTNELTHLPARSMLLDAARSISDPPRAARRTGRPRIVRIITRLNVGGPTKHVAWLTAGLGEAGFSSLLVTGELAPGEQDLGGFVRQQGVRPMTLPGLSRSLCLGDVWSIWRLLRVLIRLKPHIVHTHTAKAGAVGRIAAALYRVYRKVAFRFTAPPCRVVHTYHGHVFHSYFGRWTTWFYLTIERLLARFATDRILVISPQQLDEINRRFRVGRRAQFSVIPLGIDLSCFAHASGRRHVLRRQIDVAPGELLVGVVGRLTEIKNHALLLHAIHRLHVTAGAAGRRWRLLVIGDGHLRAFLEGEAERLGLGDRVQFLGNREDPEVFYPALDIVALSSLNEGTPLTLIEAMANARPVIATAVGGVPDLLGTTAEAVASAENGYLICERGVAVGGGDANAFCAGLGRLLGDASLRRALGAQGRRFVEERYDKSRLLHDVADLYDHMLASQ